MLDSALFELLELAFDPPDTNAYQIRKKFEQKIEELGSSLAREQEQTRLILLKEQLNFLSEIRKRLFNNENKLDVQYFKSIAEERLNEVLSDLRATVDLLAETGEKTATKRTLRSYKNEHKLSIEHVKEVFDAAGFKIIDKDPLEAFPKFPPNFDRIYDEFEAIREFKDSDFEAPSASGMVDLYGFIAFMLNDVENAFVYKSMETKELQKLFDEVARKLSQRTDNFGKLCASLVGGAKAFVFNSDQNRELYETYLIYRSKGLKSLFDKIKKTPESALLKPKFAERCINTINEYFPDYEVALAIYNKVAGFKDEFYFPDVWKFRIKCGYCDAMNEFDSEDEAVRINACSNCHKLLYRKCVKCGADMREAKAPCPRCGYDIDSAKLFPNLYRKAENALNNNDFDEARNYLYEAQSAAPEEKDRVDKLSQRIAKAEKILKEPIVKLRRLIVERKYQEAGEQLAEIIKQHPEVNVSEFETTISAELSKADRLFSEANTLSLSEKLDACVSILLQCKDHMPSIAFLRVHPPLPVSSLQVTPVSSSSHISVKWSPSGEQGISYRLIRKQGMEAVKSEQDGDILLDDSTETSFIDSDLKPGKIYTYAVFSIRIGVFSKGLFQRGVLYSEVKNCNVFQKGSFIRLTWDAPENSTGARIERTSGGKREILTESAHGNYEDTTCKLGQSCTYVIYANYGGTDRSEGLEYVITPMVVIDSFSIKSEKIKDNLFKVSWSIKQEGISLRIQVDGKQVAEAVSDDMSAEVTLPPNSYSSIRVLAYSGGKWVESENSVEVNTYSACAINKDKTTIDDNMISGRNGISYSIDLRISMADDIPQSVSGFYYAVRSSLNPERWVAKEAISSAGDIRRVSIQTYLKNNYIHFQDTAKSESAFYITVFTIHEFGGKEIISDSSRLKINRPLVANLMWSVSYGMFDGFKLRVVMQGNRPIESIPELYLCACDSSQFLISPEDKHAELLMKLDEEDLESAQSDISRVYKVKTDLPSRQLKQLKFFLFHSPDVGSDISVRWKQGFFGKL